MRLAGCLLGLALPVQAETALPALHDVTGVAANDVLNIRQSPDAASPVLGSLGPGARDVEIVAVSADGKWGQINAGEGAGWVALRYLAPQDRPAWHSLQTPLLCFGTEPFWSVELNVQTGDAPFSMPENMGIEGRITQAWPGEDWNPTAALRLAMGKGESFAALRAEACSDGMSDRAFGIRIDLFGTPFAGGQSARLTGCCSLAP